MEIKPPGSSTTGIPQDLPADSPAPAVPTAPSPTPQHQTLSSPDAVGTLQRQAALFAGPAMPARLADFQMDAKSTVAAIKGRIDALDREIDALRAQAFEWFSHFPELTQLGYDFALAPLVLQTEVALRSLEVVRGFVQTAFEAGHIGEGEMTMLSRRWHDLGNRWMSHLGYTSMLESSLRQGRVVESVDSSYFVRPDRIANLVQIIVASQWSAARAAGVSIFHAPFPPEIEFQKLDPEAAVKLDAVLTNLVTNGIKYHDPAKAPNKRTVEIRVSIHSDVGQPFSNGDLFIEVIDNGRGMSPEALRRYGQSGWRAPSVVEEGIPGTGFGSGSAMSDIESLGGRFRIDSWPGRGTVVIITIPTANLLLDEEGRRVPPKTKTDNDSHAYFGGITVVDEEMFAAIVPNIEGDDPEEWGILPGSASFADQADVSDVWHLPTMMSPPMWTPLPR